MLDFLTEIGPWWSGLLFALAAVELVIVRHWLYGIRTRMLWRRRVRKCLRCGYPTRGQRVDTWRCPECGESRSAKV